MKEEILNDETAQEKFEVQVPKYQLEALFVSSSQAMDWGLKQTKANELWKLSKGEGVTIAVLDTGVPAQRQKDGSAKIHPDLANNILLDRCKSFVPTEDFYDAQGHGTATAGVIAAEDNLLGFVGYAPEAKIICYKVLNNYGAGSLKWIERALEECIRTKPDIVSMSLGSVSCSDGISKAVKKLDSMGIPVICAAGNGGKAEGVNYPARLPEAFAIAAYDNKMEIANFSAIGDQVDFAFPGVDINTTWLKGGYTVISGTSFACPACSGVVALILSYHKKNGTVPDAKNTMWIYDELKNCATNPKKLKAKTIDWGWGFVDTTKLFARTTALSHWEVYSLARKYCLDGIQSLNSQSDATLSSLYSSDAMYSVSDHFLENYQLLSPALLIFVVNRFEEMEFTKNKEQLKENMHRIAKATYSWYNPKRYTMLLWINRKIRTFECSDQTPQDPS